MIDQQQHVQKINTNEWIPPITYTYHKIVDASEAGEGSLEILVKSTNNGQPSLPTQVESLGNAVFNVSFMPDTSIDHLIHVTFNDEPIPGN